VMALDQRVAITFVPGLPPIWTTLLRYYEDRLTPSTWAMWWSGVKMFLGTAAVFFSTARKEAKHCRDTAPQVGSAGVPAFLRARPAHDLAAVDGLLLVLWFPSVAVGQQVLGGEWLGVGFVGVQHQQ
jgi:hypothetical protein